MELSKVQKTFLFCIILFALISVVMLLTGSEKKQSVQTRAETQQSVLVEQKPDTTELSMQEINNKISSCTNKETDLKHELEEEKVKVSRLEENLRHIKTENIFNSVAWYDVPAMISAYFDKENRLEEVQNELDTHNKKARELESKRESEESTCDALKAQKKTLTQKITGNLSVTDMTDISANLDDNNPLGLSKFIIDSKDYLDEDPRTNQTDHQGAVVPNLPPFIAPIKDYIITSGFGYRIHPITNTRRFHSGTDFAADYNTPVLASNYGKVVYAGWLSGFGNTVVLSHAEGVYTLYGHNNKLNVQEGEIVQQGDVIALVGSTGASTGPHCHFSMWINDELVDPVAHLAL